MLGYERITYSQLNARQKENYNYQKVAAQLADYGFNCLRLSDDWHGADFIACHIDAQTFLKVQLKARMTIDRKYRDRDIHIAFLNKGECYVYPHDEMVTHVMNAGVMNQDAIVWRDKGLRHWDTPPRWAMPILEKYRL